MKFKDIPVSRARSNNVGVWRRVARACIACGQAGYDTESLLTQALEACGAGQSWLCRRLGDRFQTLASAQRVGFHEAAQPNGTAPSRTVLSRFVSRSQTVQLFDRRQLAEAPSLRQRALWATLVCRVEPYDDLFLALELDQPPALGTTELTEAAQAFAALLSWQLSQPGTPPLPAEEGDSHVPGSMRSWLRKIAACDLPVLIQGETGVGKEAVCRAVHRWSKRRHAPWVAVNCAALTESLLDGELFGVSRGAYTGADQNREGLLMASNGGTLFLDEVGEMSVGLQSKLLRVLQESVLRPVGATRERKVDIRIVSATHRDLSRAMASGQFREDLYYRLSTLSATVPPLRERLDELPTLVAAVEERIRREIGCGPFQWTDDGWDALRRQDWPGNIRQLHAVLVRACLRGEGRPLTASLLFPEVGSKQAFGPSTEQRMIESALFQSGENISATSRRLGWSRQKLYRRMKATGIPVP